MGLLVYDGLVISRVAEELARREKCLTLGVPTLNFKSSDFIQNRSSRSDFFKTCQSEAPFEDAKGFFRTLDFSQIDALDISDYEGANIVDDLNSPSLVDRVTDRYDLIYDSGTLEHIFDAPTALRSLTRLLRVGGAIVHATPANGFMDHGFWQISPDLYRYFYRRAGFEILTSALFIFADNPYSIDATVNLYRTKGRKYVAAIAPEAIAVFAAVKRREVSSIELGLQDYYANMHATAASPDLTAFFLPFGTAPRPGEATPATVVLSGARGSIADRARRVIGNLAIRIGKRPFIV